MGRGISGRLAWISCIPLLVLLMGVSKPGVCTSADLTLSEPVLPADDHHVRGDAMFGVVAGHVYNTVGNLGATFNIGGMEGGDFYFFPDMLTWIRNPKRNEFSPQRVVYTLEVGYSSPPSGHRWGYFIKHQSFHDIDSFDGLKESYELYGVRYQRSTDPSILLRVGRYVNRRVVDYGWDYGLQITEGLGNIGDRRLSACVSLHHVTEKANPVRNGFTDYSLEVSVDYRTGIDLFLQYESMHDIDRFAGTTDHHAIVGARYDW